MADISETPLLGNPGNWDELEQSYAALQVWLGKLRENVAQLQGSLALTPIGGIMDWAAATAPSGWLLCNGTAISRATYAALFSVIGTTYGVGDSSTTFNLPDFQGRFSLGKAASGTGAALAATGGSLDHTHTAGAISVSGATGAAAPGTDSTGTHDHGAATGGHTHSTSTAVPNDGQFQNMSNASIGVDFSVPLAAHTHPNGTTGSSTASISSDGSHSHTVNSHTHAAGTLAGSGAATGSNNPAFVVVNRIIYSGV